MNSLDIWRSYMAARYTRGRRWKWRMRDEKNNSQRSTHDGTGSYHDERLLCCEFSTFFFVPALCLCRGRKLLIFSSSSRLMCTGTGEMSRRAHKKAFWRVHGKKLKIKEIFNGKRMVLMCTLAFPSSLPLGLYFLRWTMKTAILPTFLVSSIDVFFQQQFFSVIYCRDQLSLAPWQQHQTSENPVANSIRSFISHFACMYKNFILNSCTYNHLTFWERSDHRNVADTRQQAQQSQNEAKRRVQQKNYSNHEIASREFEF